MKRGHDLSRNPRGEFGAANMAALIENQFNYIVPKCYGLG